MAVSGGIDSVVLTHLLNKCRYQFSIAHCNFKLRGNSSDEDAQFVQQLALEFNCSFHTIEFDTKEYAKTNKLSVQIAARELRYQWFNELCKEHHLDYILTAHHLNDSVETLLYNLIKGSGIKGLHGIPLSNNNVKRPLLFASKSDILSFAAQNNISHREDISNQENKYARNLIRNEIMPLIEKINPSFLRTCENNIENFKQTEAIFLDVVSNFKKEYIQTFNNQTTIRISDLKRFTSPESILFEIMQSYNFNNTQTIQMLSQKANNSGAKFYSATHVAILNRGALIVQPKTKNDDIRYYLPKNSNEILLENTKLSYAKIYTPSTFENNPNIAYFDIEKLIFPLEIRRWIPGDKFQPIGMNGQSQSLQDYFTNKKLSLFEKENTWILTSNGKIAWVIGYRSDQRFCVEKDAEQCLAFTFINKI